MRAEMVEQRLCNAPDLTGKIRFKCRQKEDPSVGMQAHVDGCLHQRRDENVRSEGIVGLGNLLATAKKLDDQMQLAHRLFDQPTHAPRRTSGDGLAAALGLDHQFQVRGIELDRRVHAIAGR
jgi:alkylhydroperoxidase family enzyme